MLTEKQNQLLDFIAGRIFATGRSPSFEEMRAHMGHKTRGSIPAAVGSLERRGFIRREKNIPRSIEIVRLPETAKFRLVPAA